MDGPRRAIDLEAPIRFAIILPYAKGAWRRRTILRQESGPFSPNDENALSPLPCFLKTNLSALLRKEVIQPQVPLRLPCYDFTPITGHTVGACLPKGWLNDFWYRRLSWCDGRCVQGPGTYSPRHADPRLLAIPASQSRVADSDPNWGALFGIGSLSRVRSPLYAPL